MRRTMWALERDGRSVNSGVTAAIDLTQDFQSRMGVVSMNGYTITRILGQLTYRSQNVPSGDNVQECSFGIGVFDANMAVTAHPNPGSEDADWMWQYTPLWVPWTIESSAGVFRILMNEIPIDVKTQRVLKAGTEKRLRFVISNVGSDPIDMNIRTRTLLRAP